MRASVQMRAPNGGDRGRWLFGPVISIIQFTVSAVVESRWFTGRSVYATCLSG
jgi:hypothetical protein